MTDLADSWVEDFFYEDDRPRCDCGARMSYDVADELWYCPRCQAAQGE